MKQSITQFIFFISSSILAKLILEHTKININQTILMVIIYICIVSVYLVYTHISKKNKEKLKVT
ncbi:hypothetical protein KPL47_19445 [Clostridium estertheticum]|uniref:hypothetical protein n=1 Tax=Clostridium estertheticum TaxID=238834 RepID=UPI001C0DF92D|nr:hypothetical protein [Clostridium estertheticum]MBU3178498.1 hypothetical protein [Clostridium estertheticum]